MHQIDNNRTDGFSELIRHIHNIVYHIINQTTIKPLYNKNHAKDGQLIFKIFSGNYTYLTQFDIIRTLFNNEDYSVSNKTIENLIFRKYVCSFYNHWDKLKLFEKYEMRNRIVINKSNFHKYYFYKICDAKIFTDIGDKMFKDPREKKLCDVKFVFN